MKYLYAFFVIVFCSCQQVQSQRLVENGRTDFVIMTPSLASDSTLKSAQILQQYIQLKSNVLIPILAETHIKDKTPVISIGNTSLFKIADSNKVDRLGYVINKTDRAIVLGGITERGIRNAIYGFLDRYLDIQMLAADDIHCVPSSTIDLDVKQELVNPIFKTFDIYNQTSYSDSYTEWYSLEHNYKEPTRWGFFDHSFFRLVPPQVFQKTNPNFYLYEGAEATQLNLADIKLRQYMVDTLTNLFRGYAHKKYWLIGQEDIGKFGTLFGSQKTLTSFYPSETDALIHFINTIASHFPHHVIGTFAYHETLPAPQQERPISNVLICFAPIDAYRHLALYEGVNKRYGDELVKWSQMTDHVMVWDYLSNFSAPHQFYPSILKLKENLDFYKQLHVESVYLEGIHSDEEPLSELLTFVAVRIIWGDQRPVKDIVHEFCKKYYGSASQEVEELVWAIQHHVVQNKDQIRFFGGTRQYLGEAQLQQYRALLEAADRHAKGNSVLEKRIAKVKLGLLKN